MKKNIGKKDKSIRLTIGAILLLLNFLEVTPNILHSLFFIAGITLIITSLISFCPAYKIFGIATCKTK